MALASGSAAVGKLKGSNPAAAAAVASRKYREID